MSNIYIKHGLFDQSDGVFKGKGISSLFESRNKKEKLLELFGGKDNMPASVMRAKKGRADETSDAAVSKRRYSSTGYMSDDKEREKVFGVSGMNVRGKGAALSTFPQNIGKTVLMLYTEPSQQVFDPFAGHNSRMELCVSNGRHYEGYDICQEFMGYNRKRADELKEFFPSAKIKLHLGDSRYCSEAKNLSADFTITSPPYWDVEWYGDEPEQLGKCKTYGQSLDGMGEVLQKNYKVLRPGSFAVWFINDFRRKGTFHLYHMDIARLGEQAGFNVHDLMVVDFGHGIRDAFYNLTFDTKVLPKRHEFGVIFRKPVEVKLKRPKIKGPK